MGLQVTNAGYSAYAQTTAEKEKKTAEQNSAAQNSAAKAEAVSSTASGKDAAAESGANVDATYEKLETTQNTATYKINKMSAEDREKIVAQLKAEQETRVGQLRDLVAQMLGQQVTTAGNAGLLGTDNMWSILAKGNFTVDAATKKQAQEDISEDGYYGVKQTSQRMFDFAAALAGDDVDKMKEMQAAMQKGYEKAEKTWGGKLPDICKQTMKAAGKLFEDYYASKKAEVADSTTQASDTVL